MAAFVGNCPGIEIFYLADRLGQATERRNLRAGRMLLRPHALEFGVAIDVGAGRPLPAAAQSGQPIFQIEKERIALLLAIIADVDAGLALFVHDPTYGSAAGASDLGLVRGRARGAQGVKARQFPRPRQAAGMGGENSRCAALHSFSRALPRFESYRRHSSASS